MVRLPGFEPGTHCLEGSCSIHLSYRRMVRECREERTDSSLLDFMVGAVRFELTAPWSQTKCATAALRPGQKNQRNTGLVQAGGILPDGTSNKNKDYTFDSNKRAF